MELYNAASVGNLDEVNRLLTAGANIETHNIHQQTPLFIAAVNGHTAIVERLLAAGANIETHNINQLTPLFVAAWKGHTAIVERLLAAGANIEARDNHQQTPLFIAAMNGHTSIVERLLAAGANIETPNSNQATPLYVAAMNGHTAIVERLLAAGANIETHNIYQLTPLFVAVTNGHTAIVERLLAAGANIEVRDGNQQTPLILAAWKGHIEIVERLLAAGANIEARNIHQATPLYIAALSGHTAIVERLLAAGANIEARNVKQGTPLLTASTNGHTATVERLLAAGANIEAKNVYGNMPLINASESGHTEIVKRLLAAGADPNKKNNEGKTAFDMAKQKGRTEIVKLLSPMWKGWNRSDVELMNTIFETEPEVEGGKPPCEDWSCCPVCLVYTKRQDGCIYMNHNCTTTGRHYHKELYEKYKVQEGYWKGVISWCTICGRICQQTPHRHYALSPADAPTTSVIERVADPHGNEPGCIAAGGGGLREKLVRFRRMREYALELNSEIGNITYEDAIEELVEEAWNAPFARKRVVNTIGREKKWNEAVLNVRFPEPLRPEEVAVTAPDAPQWPFQGRPGMMPVVEPAAEGNMNAISMNDLVMSIQLRHRATNGEIVTHDKIGIHTLFGNDAFGVLAAAGTPTFGNCFFADCPAILYPGELQYILDTYNHPESLSVEQRADYHGKINTYKQRFNAAYRDNPEFKARVDADVAVAAAMPSGGAGAAAGQGGGRRKHRTRRLRRQKQKRSARSKNGKV